MSKTCSSCGTLKEDLSLKDRVLNCHSCSLSLDRDLNASINIHRVRAQLLE
nr:transposase [Helicobacter suis]